MKMEEKDKLKAGLSDFLEEIKVQQVQQKENSESGSSTLAYDTSPRLEIDYATARAKVLTEMMKALHRQGITRMVMLPQNGEVVQWIINRLIQPSLDRKGAFIFGDNSSGKTFAITQIFTAFNAMYYSSKYIDLQHTRFYKYETIALRCNIEGNLGAVATIIPPHSSRGNIFLDDLGYMGESKLNLFGNRIDLVSKIVQRLHSLYHAGYSIYITSNLHQDIILQDYGKGTHDRILEMCRYKYWEIIGDGFRK